MAVFHVQFFAHSLQKASSMVVLSPGRMKWRGKLPVLYQLHGLSDNETAWTRYSSLERYVEELPMLVVMPDGGRGFYCDAAEGYAYESHIMKDVIGFVEQCFPARRDRGGRAIGGLSMGGYGAMKLGLKYPDKFSSVVSHSSAFHFAHGERRFPNRPRRDQDEFRRIVGETVTGGPNDVFALAEKVKPKDAPAIRFDCGVKDGLLEQSRALHKRLRKLKIRHEYREYPGDHNWTYWDAHIQEAITFHCKHWGKK